MKSSLGFRWLVIGTIAATYILIVIGAVVRVTGSGLGCPDWPLCHGRLFPPLEFAALIEYSHRLMGAFVSMLILWVVSTVWLRFREQRLLIVFATTTIVLLVLQIILGAITVLTELSSMIVLLHLGLAMLVLGTLTALAVFITSSNHTLEVNEQEFGHLMKLSTASMVSMVAVYALVLSGAAVRATGATFSCFGWPECNNILLPLGVDPLVDIHLLHRFAAYTIAGLVIWTVSRARRCRRFLPNLWWLSICLLIAVVTQGSIGIWGVSNGFAPIIQAFHVAGAAALWTIAVALSALVSRNLFFVPKTVKLRVSDKGQLMQSDDRLEQTVLTSEAAPSIAGGPDLDTGKSLFRARSDHSTGGSKIGGRFIRAFIQLTKPRIILLLLAPTLCAMIVASEDWPSLKLVVATLVGGALAAGAANSFNQYFDRDIDAVMHRTANRALPAGVLQPRQAVWFGIALSALSFFMLSAFTNLLAALLAQLAIVFYVVVYTLWLKRSTPNNIVIGGAAGAVPPLVGWAAVTGNLELLPLYLFTIIFFWTPPHFWALSLIMKDDYARAQIPMLPVVRGNKETRRQIVLYSLLLVAITLLLTAFRLTGLFYLASAILLGGMFVLYAVKLLREASIVAARRLFKYSIIYLYLILVAIVVDQKFINL